MLGRLVRIRCGASGEAINNLAGERTAELSVSVVSLSSANTSAGTRKIRQKKSWAINGEILFTPAEFVRLYGYMLHKKLLTVYFGDYQGTAYVSGLSIAANVETLVRCRVKMQGTGPLVDNS